MTVRHKADRRLPELEERLMAEQIKMLQQVLQITQEITALRLRVEALEKRKPKKDG